MSDDISPCQATKSGEVADLLIEIERIRLQSRIDACLERCGGNVADAVTGRGIGISYLFAKDIVRALDHAEREIDRLQAALRDITGPSSSPFTWIRKGWAAPVTLSTTYPRRRDALPPTPDTDDGCCHKTRIKGAPCPIGRTCPYIQET